MNFSVKNLLPRKAVFIISFSYFLIVFNKYVIIVLPLLRWSIFSYNWNKNPNTVKDLTEAAKYQARLEVKKATFLQPADCKNSLCPLFG